jgi:uncharacterized protein HemX
MKPMIVRFSVLFLAFAVGAGVSGFYFLAQLRSQMTRQLRTVGDEQALVAAVSLGALDKLEAGQSEQAKSLLARQVAQYYQTFQKLQPASESRLHLMQRIEISSAKSATLKEALAKNPQ